MYEWVLYYGENQQHIMRGGYKHITEDLAREMGEDFVRSANTIYEHYPNPRIEVIPAN